MKRAGLTFPAVLVILSACAGPQSPLAPAGEQAERLYSLLTLMTWMCGVLYVAVLLFLAWGLWKARGRSNGDIRPTIEPQDAGLQRSLKVWAGIIVVGLIILSTASFLADRGLALARDRDALEIRITGHQWWWRIEYHDPISRRWIETANELHLPANQTARLALGSADVIHSFWVPNVAGKMDVIPGRANVLDVTPHRIGWFRGQCAEFCGAQHAHMAFDVKVESPRDFAAWLHGQAQPAIAPTNAVMMQGMRVVTGGQCSMCHVVRGTPAAGRPGPDLTHIGSRRSIASGTMAMSRGALQGWIAQPQALKPGTMMPPVALDPADADAVSRYLESLK
jgi:cytochrome c oxidase subunit 2